MISPVLWQNSTQTICILDVPCSIAAAQGTPSRAWHHCLQSCEPLQHPYPSNEPRSDAGKANLILNSVDQALHQEFEAILQRALGEIREHHRGIWCRPRRFVAQTRRTTPKRKLEEVLHTQDDPGSTLSAHLLASIAHGHLQTRLATGGQRQVTKDTDCAGDLDLDFYIGRGDEREALHTISIAPTALSSKASSASPSSSSSPGTDGRYRFHVPAKSTFSLTSCANARAFHTSVRNQAQEESTRKHFDLILLDPPWPNRSVKRTHKTAGSTYSTQASVSDVRKLLVSMDLDMLMNDSCLVAIWITNKQAIRDLILGKGGMFESWGVELTEEWLWLKTTTHGEPVSPIDALWRKPYEVLLVGRKHRYTDAPAWNSVEYPKRRVVVSVPDLHSRKPCLKELFQPLLPPDYRALEIFARNLVSGWWSWGDECIKFNWEGYWNEDDEPFTTTGCVMANEL